MKYEQWLRKLLDESMALAPDKRAEFLETHCEGHAVVLEELLAELRSRVDDDLPDDAPTPNDPRMTPTLPVAGSRTREEPERIGPYRIIEKIGEGGMGSVYRAEQRAPIRRQVAVKLIRSGMDTKQVLARFDAEKNALSLMNHPNIARVLDSGQTDEGWPFFVMEYVDGTPFTEYCQREKLPLEERLRLFQQVCEGVQHAHTKAVVHRDLKPANVLVTRVDGKPVPKIIDFGLAKALTAPLTDMTMITLQRQIMGTLDYMSPEQAGSGGSDVDTRTDVYALGVMLYELLVDQLPFDLRKKGDEEIFRIIREDDPPRPSVRLSQLTQAESSRLAQVQGTDPGRLLSRLQGELDWIVLRALEKQRDRRYGSPTALAEDIERHLVGHEPVDARPPSAMYRLRKFTSKHRVTVVTTGLVVFLLAAGIVAEEWQRRRANDRSIRLGKALDRASKAELKATELLATATSRLERLNRQLYRNEIAAAHRAWMENLRDEMKRRLAACPEDHRGWEWRFLSKLCRSTSSIDPGNFQLAALSPTGKFAATLRETELSVWDLKQMKLLFSKEGCHLRPSFSADESLVVVGAGFGKLTAYHVPTGEALVLPDVDTIEQPTHPAHPPDNPRRVTGGSSFDRAGSQYWFTAIVAKHVHGYLCDLSRQSASSFVFPGSRPKVIAFSPDGRLAVKYTSSKERHRVEIWRIPDDAPRVPVERPPLYRSVLAPSTLKGPSGIRRFSRFTAEGPGAFRTRRRARTVIRRTGDWGTLRVRKLDELKVDGAVESLDFSNNGRFVFLVTGNVVQVWNLESRELIARLGHPQPVGLPSVVFADEARGLAGTYASDGFRVWNFHLGNEVLVHRGFEPLAATSNGELVLARDAEGLGLRDTVEHQEVATIRLEEPLVELLIQPGAGFMGATAKGAVLRWRLVAPEKPTRLRSESSTSLKVVRGPGETELAFLSPSRLSVWDWQTKRERRNVQPIQGGRFKHLLFDRSSSRLLGAAPEGVWATWDASNLEQVGLQKLAGDVTSVAILPRKSELAIAQPDSSVTVRKISPQLGLGGGRILESIPSSPSDEPQTITVLAASNDGRHLAAGTPTGINVWDAATGELSYSMDTAQPVDALLFGPDDRRLLSLEGESLRIRDASTGHVLMSLGPLKQPMGHKPLLRWEGEMIALAGETVIWVWNSE